MLELKNLSLPVPRGADEAWLLRDISLRLPPGHLCAIVGPSGCGKTTLLKTIAGMRSPEEGSIHWDGRDLEADDLAAHEIGYVPQFGIAYELLTVRESVEAALLLRVGGWTEAARTERTAEILANVGLEEIADRLVRVLSGGQRRRLALALEMASAPLLLLCDEVTSGLDPQAEDEIVQLLGRLAHGAGEERVVLSVTHSLAHLAVHDSVIVLFHGRLVYHGPPALVLHYFGLRKVEELFPHLDRREVEAWTASWAKHRAEYESSLFHDEQKVARAHDEAVPEVLDVPELRVPSRPATREFVPPAWGVQFQVLLRRRARLFWRDRGQFWLQVALLFGFPCLVVIFAWDGLPQIQHLSGSGNAVQQLLESATYALRSSRVAGLVSGLVMFQVILLTLVGANNSSREIAGERPIFEKEKFSGLLPSSYIASKAVFLGALVSVQSLWMAVFVSTICRFPGDLFTQAGLLLLVNGAMTALCLGISSITRTAEQASLMGVYLVGFQLPLSGAVLALPKIIGYGTQPFIAAYWGWSGYLQTMRDTGFYDAVQSVSETQLAAIGLCQWVLAFHIIGGLVLAYLGCKNSRWE